MRVWPHLRVSCVTQPNDSSATGWPAASQHPHHCQTLMSMLRLSQQNNTTNWTLLHTWPWSFIHTVTQRQHCYFYSAPPTHLSQGKSKGHQQRLCPQEWLSHDHVIIRLEQSDSCNTPGEDVCTYSKQQTSRASCCHSLSLKSKAQLMKRFNEADPDSRGGKNDQCHRRGRAWV